MFSVILRNMGTRGRHRTTPGKTELKRYLAKGMTQREIAEAWEEDTGVRVSRSGIAMAIARYDLESAHTNNRYTDLLPWRVAEPHMMAYDARMLRWEARRRRGLSVPEEWLVKLAAWRRRLEEENAVVAYDRTLPDGFVWLKRTEDDDDLIRRPKD